MGIYDNDEHSGCAHSQRNETLLSNRIRVFARQREVIGQNRRRLRKPHAVGKQVCFGFGRISVNPDCLQVYGQLYSFLSKPVSRFAMAHLAY